jgi:hypothetical protein
VYVALVIQRARGMSHIANCGLPALQYFAMLSLKWQGLLEEVFEHKTCVLILPTIFV